MDKDITSASWGALISKSWKDNFKKLIEIKTEFCGINYIRIYLPYILMVRLDKTIEIKEASKITDYDISYNIMSLCIKEEFNKKSCFIELSLPGEFIEQSITRLQGFSYKWSKNRVTIKKQIATFDTDAIIKHAEDLAAECERFKFVYCK